MYCESAKPISFDLGFGGYCLTFLANLKNVLFKITFANII